MKFVYKIIFYSIVLYCILVNREKFLRLWIIPTEEDFIDYRQIFIMSIKWLLNFSKITEPNGMDWKELSHV